jgi:hypothetical protein
LESYNSKREEEAAALRKWFSAQKRFASWSAMERALKITKDYLRHIKNGQKRAADPELRSKLYDTTGLEIFRTTIGNLKPKKQTGGISRQRQEERKTTGLIDDPYERAARVKKLLVGLADELEFFKKKQESARRAFRKVVPGEDVGYITTLLRALYDEDQFQRWLLFSDYKLRSKEESQNVSTGKD